MNFAKVNNERHYASKDDTHLNWKNGTESKNRKMERNETLNLMIGLWFLEWFHERSNIIDSSYL